MFNESLSYNDVLLVPQYSDIKSRKEVDISSNLGQLKFDIPIIASPMDTISEAPMAEAMSVLGGLSIIHRYNTPEEQAQIVKTVTSTIPPATVGGAIGTSGDYLERASALVKAGAKVLCVDVAHGHHTLMKTALRSLRVTFGTKVHIMAGNVATLEGYNDLVDWGADSVQLGLTLLCLVLSCQVLMRLLETS